MTPGYLKVHKSTSTRLGLHDVAVQAFVTHKSKAVQTLDVQVSSPSGSPPGSVLCLPYARICERVARSLSLSLCVCVCVCVCVRACVRACGCVWALPFVWARPFVLYMRACVYVLGTLRCNPMLLLHLSGGARKGSTPRSCTLEASSGT